MGCTYGFATLAIYLEAGVLHADNDSDYLISIGHCPAHLFSIQTRDWDDIRVI